MTVAMHVAISGWLLGEPSGANRRLLAVVEHAAALLERDERITVLHHPDVDPRLLFPAGNPERVSYRPIAIPRGTTWQRVAHERRELGAALEKCGATLLDHAFLPVPRIPIPMCVTIHDVRAVEGLSRWPRWVARRAVRRAGRRAASIVVPSEFTARRVHRTAPAAKIAVIGNGVELPVEPERGPDDTNDRERPLVHVGHLERRKNLALLLHALAELTPTERPRLVLAGRDGGEELALRTLTRKLQLADHVEFRGVITDTEVEALLRDARAVVVPSKYEGFGLVALDALAHGKPTLVADAGALPEVVGPAGTRLPADDPSAWAAAIRATAADDPAAAAARRARAQEFSWHASAAATVALWRELSARRS
ncbi:MAG: glycosyltransferase [bacterium]|nr:glycosyltransferase [bacterium]